MIENIKSYLIDKWQWLLSFNEKPTIDIKIDYVKHDASLDDNQMFTIKGRLVLNLYCKNAEITMKDNQKIAGNGMEVTFKK